MPDRRIFLKTALGALTAAGALPAGLLAATTAREPANVPLRGMLGVSAAGLDAGKAGLEPASSADQSARLQALLEQAAAEGLALILPAGRYHIARLELPDGSAVIGAPGGASQLIATGDGTMLAARGVSRVTLRDVSLEGRRFARVGGSAGLVALNDVEALMLDGVSLSGGSGHGLALDRCSGTIRGCRISHAAGAGLYALDSRGLSVSDNSVEDCGNGGILIHRRAAGPDGTIVSRNRIARIAATAGGTGQNGNGINAFRADGVTIADNIVAECSFSAIRANSSSDIVIRGNQARASGETAIYCEFAFSGAVVAENLVDGAANGISVVNLDAGGRLATISGNLVRNLRRHGPYPPEGPGFGIGIAVEADCAVSGNTIENAPRWGLLIGWGPYLRDVAVTGNVIRQATIGMAVSVVEGSGGALVTGNLFSGTPGGAIVGHRWADAASGDLLAMPTDALPPRLTLAGNRRG